MEFKQEQLTTVLRHRNNIEAVKITNISDGNLILERFNGKTEKMPVSYPARYRVGQFLDVIIFKTGNSSHGMKLVGITPPEFYPEPIASEGV